MRLGIVVCLLLGTVACGKKLKAGTTPEETVRNVEAALRQLDVGAVYDMLSTRCQRELDQMLDNVKAMLGAVPHAQLKQAGLADFTEMTPREILVRAIDRAKDEAPEALQMLKSFQIAILEVKQYGDRATVEVMTMANGGQTRNAVELVREGGYWKLDSDDSLSNLPVNLAPPVPPPAAFT